MLPFYLAAKKKAEAADLKNWAVLGTNKQNELRVGDISVTVDSEKSGNTYLAPYTQWHSKRNNTNFVVPVGAVGKGSFAANTITSWTMVVSDSSGQTINTCSGTFDSDNCIFGQHCEQAHCKYNETNKPDYGWQQRVSEEECLALGDPDGCSSKPEKWWNQNGVGGPWIKGCRPSSDFKVEENNVCSPKRYDVDDIYGKDNMPCYYSNMPAKGSCGTNQSSPGAQFCDTLLLSCPAIPTPGVRYGIDITLEGNGVWNATAKATEHLSATYIRTNDRQSYVGTYQCEVPKDDTSQKDLCQGDITQWTYKEHPEYHYNKHTFSYPSYPSKENDAPVVAAYWSEWAAYKRFSWEIEQGTENALTKRRYYAQNTPFDQLTHVLYAFIPICGNGESSEGQLSLCAVGVNDCLPTDDHELLSGNPYFNLRAKACKFAEDGSEAPTTKGALGSLASDFELVFHDPWSEFHVAGGGYLAIESVKQQYPDLKILPSVGGWSLSKMFFYLDKPEFRKKFVASCKKFLTTWKVFDGIDIDWEFPGGHGQDDGSSVGYYEFPDDIPSELNLMQYKNMLELRGESLKPLHAATKQEGNKEKDPITYNLLMKDLRAMLDSLGKEMGRSYQLSSAISAGAEKIKLMKYGEVSDELDHIFLMSYDLAGAWSNIVGHQTPVYRREDNSLMESTSNSVDLLINQNFPAKKIVVGAAMYGRGWKNPIPLSKKSVRFLDDDGSSKTGIDYYGSNAKDGACTGDSQKGVIDYGSIARKIKNNECEVFYDECAQAPLARCKVGDGYDIYTYDNARSIKAKADYVKEKKLGGLFAWVLDQDNGTILNAMHKYLGNKCLGSCSETLPENYPARTCTKPGPNPGPNPGPKPGPQPQPQTGSVCCVLAENFKDHAQCDGKSYEGCKSTSCTWTSNCIAVYDDKQAPPTPTTPPTPTPTYPPTTTPTSPPTTSPTSPPTPTTKPSGGGSTGKCTVKPNMGPWGDHCNTDNEDECVAYWQYCVWTGSGGGDSHGCTVVPGMEDFAVFCGTDDITTCNMYPAYCKWVN